MMKYLRKAPTLIVLGITGFVGWPIVSAERDPGPPKPADKPAATDRPATSAGPFSLRDPFQVDRPQGKNATPTSNPAPTPASTPTPGNSANLASLKSGEKKGELPELMADEDRVLYGMRLGGTFIDDREKLAVIDNKVYSRGDQLRGADGSLLPYVVMEVRKDRAVVRRGRRDFVIAFSDTPRIAGPRAMTPMPPSPGSQARPMAKNEAGAGPMSPTNARGQGPGGQAPANAGDPKEMILQLLSGLGGQAGSNPTGGPSPAGGLAPNALGAGVNQDTISAGLDALMGKYDNIGRDGAGSIPSNPGGGTP